MTQQQANTTTGSPPPEKEEAIARLLQSTGFEIRSENGQRRYAAPADAGAPPRGCEVFAGKLPRDAFEDELVPLFERAGAVRELRLMMEPGPANRGFAFVVYGSPEEARRAVETLDGHELRRGRRIGVCKSVDNCRLFVGGIPKSRTRDEILAEMRRVTEGVVRVILYSSVADKSKNRGFAFVEYESHRAAAAARRKLMPGRIRLFEHDVAVDWAEPEPEVDEEVMAKVTVLYVRNLMMSTTEDKLKEIFSFNNNLKVDKVKKLRDFAFVHYRSREDAQEALDKLNETEIEGSVVEVTWAKPADRVNRPPRRPPPLFYAYDPFVPPFAACPGRPGLVPRIPLRGRGRGAAGVRRFRSFSAGQPVKSADHSNYFHGSKHNKSPEKNEQFETGYYLVPLPGSSEGLENSVPLPGPSLLPHGPRYPPPSFLYHPAGYDDHYSYYVPFVPGNPTF